jgi:3-hydroxyacyl-[acyl-carrier-protein] dehydratase
MSQSRILESIPHRPPFLLVDEVVDEKDGRIVCRKRFTGEEWFFQGHYPGSPLVPGVLLCEAAMQAGAVLLSKHLEGKKGVPVATRMNDVRFKQIIRPGDTVELEVELKERLADAFFLSAKVMLGGKAAVRFEFACTLARPEE